eukprot:765149-Hanusia_phi.AAC.7
MSSRWLRASLASRCPGLTSSTWRRYSVLSVSDVDPAGTSGKKRMRKSRTRRRYSRDHRAMPVLSIPLTAK